MEEEPGLDTGDHATAEERYAAAAAQLKGRDKLDREQLRELRQQMRAEKKVRWNPEPVLPNTPKLRIRQMQTLKESLDGADISCSLMWWCVKTGKEASELHSPSVILREPCTYTAIVMPQWAEGTPLTKPSIRNLPVGPAESTGCRRGCTNGYAGLPR